MIKLHLVDYLASFDHDNQQNHKTRHKMDVTIELTLLDSLPPATCGHRFTLVSMNVPYFYSTFYHFSIP